MTDAAPIPFDLPCLECRYNLRGLRAGGKCPECGRWIHDTIRASQYRVSLHDGLMLAVRSAWSYFVLPIALLLSVVDVGATLALVIVAGSEMRYRAAKRICDAVDPLGDSLLKRRAFALRRATQYEFGAGILGVTGVVAHLSLLAAFYNPVASMTAVLAPWGLWLIGAIVVFISLARFTDRLAAVVGREPPRRAITHARSFALLGFALLIIGSIIGALTAGTTPTLTWTLLILSFGAVLLAVISVWSAAARVLDDRDLRRE